MGIMVGPQWYSHKTDETMIICINCGHAPNLGLNCPSTRMRTPENRVNARRLPVSEMKLTAR
jgi:hypothetical protein